MKNLLINVKRLFFNRPNRVDSVIYICVLILVGFGITMIGSASIGSAGTSGAQVTIRTMTIQSGFVILGFIVMHLMIHFFKTEYLTHRLLMVAYWLGIASMFLCLLWEIKGAHAWIKIPGGFTIQPAEFMKILMIVFISYCLTRIDGNFVHSSFKSIAQKEYYYREKCKRAVIHPTMYFLFVLFVGVVIQKDMGTMSILAAIGFCLFLATPRKYYRRFKVVALVSIIIFILLGIIFSVFFLETYQIERIASWLNPLGDPYDASMQLVNALIAFANGGITGLGFGDSTQKFGYIPESHNDFIGAIAYEEFGIFAILLMIIPTVIIIFRFLKFADKVEDECEKMILFGISTYFFMHLLINLGGISGLIPMTGVPLLLVSYGGSSMLSCLMAVGLGQSIIKKYYQNHNYTNS